MLKSLAMKTCGLCAAPDCIATCSTPLGLPFGLKTGTCVMTFHAYFRWDWLFTVQIQIGAKYKYREKVICLHRTPL